MKKLTTLQAERLLKLEQFLKTTKSSPTLGTVSKVFGLNASATSFTISRFRNDGYVNMEKFHPETLSMSSKYFKIKSTRLFIKKAGIKTAPAKPVKRVKAMVVPKRTKKTLSRPSAAQNHQGLTDAQAFILVVIHATIIGLFMIVSAMLL